MSKKTILISAIIIILVLVAGGFFLYKKDYFSKQLESLTTAKFFELKIKDETISSERVKFYQDKVISLKEEIKKSPDDINKWLSLGITKKAVNDFDGARDIFLYVIKKYPTDATAFGNLADLYANFLNDSVKAEEYYKKAIENSPTYVNYYVGLAELYRFKMPGKEALYEEVILDASKKFPQDYYFISLLAGYYRQTNQTQKAIEYYEKLIKLAPDNQAAKEDLAELKQIKN